MRPIRRQAFSVPSASSVAVRASENGSRPRSVALGMRCTARAGNLKWAARGSVARSTVAPALFQHDRERFGREQMAAGAAGAEEDQFVDARLRAWPISAVMPGLVPGIHAFIGH